VTAGTDRVALPGGSRSSGCSTRTGRDGGAVTSFLKDRAPWPAPPLDRDPQRPFLEVLVSDAATFAPPFAVPRELWGPEFDFWRWAHLPGPVGAMPDTAARNATVAEVLAEVGGTHAWFLVEQTYWAIGWLRGSLGDRMPSTSQMPAVDAERAALRLEHELFAAPCGMHENPRR
jgi:hypothetical protein